MARCVDALRTQTGSKAKWKQLGVVFSSIWTETLDRLTLKSGLRTDGLSLAAGEDMQTERLLGTQDVLAMWQQCRLKRDVKKYQAENEVL